MKQLNAANVMVAIRDHLANTEDDLCKVLFVSPSYGRYELEMILRELIETGLIEHSGPGSFSGTFEVTPNWKRIQATLGLSLKQLGEARSDTITVAPFFGKPAGGSPPLDVFVVMSFKPALRPIYEDHILNVTKSLNVAAKRADDFFGAHHIMSDVWEAINAARLIIADCTGRNPNVFYEIGMAHTLGKTVILITQNKNDVPFDLQTIRYIQYEYTPPGMKLFEGNLLGTLQLELKASSEGAIVPPYYGVQSTGGAG